MAKTRMFFVSDVHGSDKLFYKLMHAGDAYKANILVIGGDIAGKSINPIFEGGNNGSYKTNIHGVAKSANSKEELEGIEKEIRFMGDYPYVTSEAGWKELRQDETKMTLLFDQLIAESVKKWCEVAEERLKPQSVRLIVNQGNDDPPILEKTIRESSFVEYVNEKVTELDSFHEMMSLGYANMTPWVLPGDITEEKLAEKIENLAPGVKRMENCTFNFHVPPYDTHLDIAPLLDANLTPKLTPGGEPEMTHVGSTAVRKAIEKYKPLLGLHGHIHESKGYSKIGRTQCFNPGSEYAIGILDGVILDLAENKLANYAFTTG